MSIAPIVDYVKYQIFVKYVTDAFFVLPTPVSALKLIYKLLKPNTFILSKGVHCTRTSLYAPPKTIPSKYLHTYAVIAYP